jgi:hypothetical protein
MFCAYRLEMVSPFGLVPKSLHVHIMETLQRFNFFKMLYKHSVRTTSTAALRVVRGDKKGNPVPGSITGPPGPGGYKYGDLALQVGGVSDETVKYGREFCRTST